MSLLSNLQKAEIGKLAREAWLAWTEHEAFLAVNDGMSESACFTHWRHWQQGLACGRQSLRACTSEDDFLKLRAHFLALLGRTEQAARVLVRHAAEPRLMARHKLSQALRERGLSDGYAAAICRRQFRCELADASPRQLWCLVYTVRSRRPAVKAEGGKLKAEVGSENPF